MNHRLAISRLCGDKCNTAKMTISWTDIQEHSVLILVMLRQTLACSMGDNE